MKERKKERKEERKKERKKESSDCTGMHVKQNYPINLFVPV